MAAAANAKGRSKRAKVAPSGKGRAGAAAVARALASVAGRGGEDRADFREAARRAYAVGDLGWATYYYREHLARQPRDAQALVELANIHSRTGQHPRAASLYYDAARVLLDGGNRSGATRLIPAVAEGNPALANDLYSRLAAPPR
jgi:hypothetical protein